MKKFIILLLIIFAVSYAQTFDDAEVKEYYYKILLKKWQKSGDYQEFNPLFSRLRWLDYMESGNMAKDEVRKHCKGLGKVRSIETDFMGKNLEYQLARIRGLPENEQMWLLISVPLKKVVATHNDKIKPDIPAKNPHHWLEEWDARVLYVYLLTKWKESRHFEEYSPLSWEWWKNTDSVTAVSQAIKTAREHYGQEMAALPPRLMGNNDEFWLVYCFPSIQFEKRISSCEDHLVWRYEKGRLVRPQTYIDKEPDCYKKFDNLMSKTNELGWCYYSIMRRYEDARLYWASSDCMEKPPDCFQLIVVLISKADGQVLYTEENKRSPHECASYEERVRRARKLFDLK